MTSANYIMALDLGTTGNRAIIFDRDGNIAGQAYKELTQYYPQPGWVEHDPREIWQDIDWAIGAAIGNAEIQPGELAAIGLTVQRETCLLWDSDTGRPLQNAIVWQDRRTAPMCNQLRDMGKAEEIAQRTGLVLDAYFSATKLAWLLDRVKEETDPPVDFNRVLAGTVDSWVLWNLTGRQVHATDHSNASRTMLLNIETGDWDESLLALFNIPPHMMPIIRPSLGLFGHTDPGITGAEIPIMAIFGDQQAALYGHGCDRPGLLKCTYGTGAFLVSHTGDEIARSQNQLLTTIAWSEATDQGPPHIGYALEGSMFTAGSCIQWLRDGIRVITSAADTESLAEKVSDNGGLYFVPALSGLGAPHWDMSARGAFLGITSAAQREHMVRAVLEAIAYEVKEVVDAVNQDAGTPIKQLVVDGGACRNNFLMQFQADALGIPVERPTVLDVTAQGAAFAAGLAVGFWNDYRALVTNRPTDRVFEPGDGTAQAQANFAFWQKAVERAKHWAE
ncbi:Glycerol kinase [Halomicronema hongdechloris C2206]|uniref:Glycerol kinase n=1 Tax=Halomicronema hongdechloris C2206 TaxID=1641165 RepID=A0A1Z3HFX7_9CYAN|nr:glycerol kinase GlpK [Halomicronema hongdechloris]ASC69157.1 Glycerol kinase [Halomicronema hongdechloris C2206]